MNNGDYLNLKEVKAFGSSGNITKFNIKISKRDLFCPTRCDTQLFGKGSGRHLKSNFGVFNTQWTLVPNWNRSLKYLSAFHFLTKTDDIFCGVNMDAMTAKNNFLRSLDTLEMLDTARD